MAMRKGDADFRAVVNAASRRASSPASTSRSTTGGSARKGELPYPMSAAVRSFMIYQVGPRVTHR
jgi:hypothetical protein